MTPFWRYAAILVVVAGVSRLPQLTSPHLLLDGDEAILGLMAKHLAEGREIPIFLYGVRERARLQRVIDYLEAHGVRHVFSAHGLLQWQLMFYSREGIVARYLGDRDRYPPYVASGPRARRGRAGGCRRLRAADARPRAGRG